jgi:hypothetical protein
MATLVDDRFRITTAAGVPVSGGKLRIYNANTTTLSTIYSDAALSVPLTNPVVADSGGWCAQVFIGDGAYDLATLTAADVVIKTYEDVPSVGSGTSGLDFTLPSGHRFVLTDNVSEVLMQVGDPSPDNVGGSMTIEGRAGTQGDTLTLDFADVAATGDVAVAGGLTVGGQVVQSVLSTGTQTAAANFNIPIPTGYHSLTVELYDIVPTNASDIRVTASIDNAATYVAGANYTSYGLDMTAGTSLGAVATSYWYGTLGNMSTTAGVQQTITMHLETPLSGTGESTFTGDASCGGGGQLLKGLRGIFGGRITNLKFTVTAGTFTCKWRVRVRGT